MNIDSYTTIKEYQDLFCIDNESFKESINNLENIMVNVSDIFEYRDFEEGIKIHFPDELTLKYTTKDWNDELNLRVLMKKIIHCIAKENDIDIETISAQPIIKFKFFNSDFSVSSKVPEYFDNPLDYIIGVDTNND